MDFDKTTIDDKTKVTGCINQLFRPQFSIPRPGTGDCKNCHYDPIQNPKCSGFYKITLHQITVVAKVEEPKPQIAVSVPELSYEKNIYI